MIRRPESKTTTTPGPNGGIRDGASTQAALALLESLILTLIDRRLLTVEDAVETVEIAIDANRSMTQEGPEDPAADVAVGLLSDIANSVRAARPAPKPSVKGRRVAKPS